MDKVAFARVAESLGQYRRADLRDFEDELGRRPVDALYVDPLPGDAILASVLTSNTTFLLGRKGTGKSTIFARAQSVLRSKHDVLSTYIDVKSLYDIVDANDIPVMTGADSGVDSGILRIHLLRKAFLGKVLSELLKEIDAVCQAMSIWERWSSPGRSFAELKAALTKLRERVTSPTLDDQELPILQHITRKWKSQQQSETSGRSKLDTSTSTSLTGLKGEIHASFSDFDKSLNDTEVYNE